MKRVILIALLAIMSVSLVMAYGKGLNEKMDLSEDQIEKINKIKSDFKKQMVDLEANHKKATIDLKNVMKDPKASNDKLMAAFDKVHESQNNIESNHIEMMLQIREILDDKQKENFAPYLYSGMGNCCGMHHGGMSKGDHKCSHDHAHGKGDHRCQHGKEDASKDTHHNCKHHK